MSNEVKEPEVWRPPVTKVGTMVLWHCNPFHPDPSQAVMGWISQPPGHSTVNCLVWAPSTGFVEKASVRHKDDPFWKESETAAAWSKWGCYEVHPDSIALNELRGLITRMKVDAASKAEKTKGGA